MPDAVVIIESAFADLWGSLLIFFPRLIGAIIVFVVGLIVAWLLKGLVIRICDFLKIDALAEKLEVKQAFKRAGMNLRVGSVLGFVVKWFFVVVFLVAATDILGWNEVTGFLTEVVLYLPNVLISVIILLVGILVANFTRNAVKTAVKAAALESADFLAGISRWSILIFSFMAALVQLQIAGDLIRTLFTGLVAMLAIAGGLAFGLGGKDHANRFLSHLRREMTSSQE
ncbi:MAG: hypothetical protein AAB337_03310 [Patescibacteria group bacterium]